MNGSSLFELIDIVCDLMDRSGIVYAITGSVASSAYSEPYTSVDVDLCLHASPAAVESFLKIIPGRFYHHDEAIRDAARRHSMINLTDNQTGWKVDLSFMPESGYLAQVLSRRQEIQYGLQGKSYWTVSPEDIILMKLLWRKDTLSIKQFENALSVMRAQRTQLDWSYLHAWADQLGFRSDLEEVKAAAGV
jgi:hypothetical protein